MRSRSRHAMEPSRQLIRVSVIGYHIQTKWYYTSCMVFMSVHWANQSFLKLRILVYWLSVLERVTYKLCIMVYSCLQGQAPQYLVDLCLPVSDVASRQHLKYVSRRLLVLPHHQLQKYGRRAFSVADPSVCYSLRDNFRDPIECHQRQLPQTLFVLHIMIYH